MQKRVPIRSIVALAALALLAAAPSSWATDSCKDEAKQGFKDCKVNSKEDYQSAKDACLNRDHQCVEVCRADRYDCRQATGFDAAIQQCDDTLAAAKTTCRANNPAGSPERDMCIDQAQVVAFQCRDSAREAAKPGLKQCRRDFVTCATACPPAAPDAPVDPKQCKLDAQTAYKAAKAACVEDFQVEKDACRHRDHTCVEQCRADRDSCRQPTEDQLASDVAACNSTRDTAINNCKSLYADGTPERDQCIDNAQVTAFECRDHANENARPGFQTCRANFQTCVQSCPLN
jgi:hypothetical protein